MQRKLKPLGMNQILLSRDSVTKPLIERARKLQRLTTHLQSILPSPLDQHSWVLNTVDDELIVATDSPVWSARLRFLVPQILARFYYTQNGENVKFGKVRVCVRPKTALFPALKGVSRPPARPKNLKIISDMAADLAGTPLGGALARLAKTLADSDKDLD